MCSLVMSPLLYQRTRGHRHVLPLFLLLNTARMRNIPNIKIITTLPGVDYPGNQNQTTIILYSLKWSKNVNSQLLKVSNVVSDASDLSP